MTDPDPEAYPWLPLPTVLAWLKLESTTVEKVDLADVCRRGAADWIEGQRPDLATITGEGDDAVRTFAATDRVVMAGLLATARLFARTDSPNGVVAFDETTAGSLLARDPDVARQLGRAKWRVG